MPDEGLVVIGVVTRAHGVRGAVRVRPTGETLGTMRAGEPVRLSLGDGPTRELVIATIGSGPSAVVTFTSVTDREAASALSGARLLVPEARLVGGDDESFYRFELVGMTVQYGGRVIGEVKMVTETPANDVLVVDTADGELLVPFTMDAVPEVDRASRTLVVRGDLFPTEDAP